MNLFTFLENTFKITLNTELHKINSLNLFFYYYYLRGRETFESAKTD